MGDLIVKVLIVQYIVVAVCYVPSQQWAKVGYFICAAGISVCVLFMK